MLLASVTDPRREFLDSEFRINDDVDPTKQIAFQASGISTSTVRTITMPDNDVDLGTGGSFQPSDADLTALANLTTTGVVVRTGAGTATTRTITGTANEITVTNGDGVSGDPTLSLPSTVNLTNINISGTLTYSTTTFSLLADTSDASDTKRIVFGGGGALSDSRGAYVSATGNEFGSSVDGFLVLVAGNVAGGKITLQAGGGERLAVNATTVDVSSGTIFNVDDTTDSTSTGDGAVVIDGGMGLAMSLSIGGNITFSNGALEIFADTADGSDTKRIVFGGGGGFSSDRGSYILSMGNEYGSGIDGNIVLQAGNVSGAKVSLNAPGGERAYIDNNGLIVTSAGTLDVQSTTDASSTSVAAITTDGGLGVAKAMHLGTNLTIGGTVTYTANAFTIFANTSDGSDTSRMAFGGGGAFTSDQGAYVIVGGNEHGSSPGHAIIQAGNVASGKVGLNAPGGERLVVDNNGVTLNSTGTLDVQSTTNATSDDTGAIKTAGGISCEKDFWVGGSFFIADTDEIELRAGTASTFDRLDFLANRTNVNVGFQLIPNGTSVASKISLTNQSSQTNFGSMFIECNGATSYISQQDVGSPTTTSSTLIIGEHLSGSSFGANFDTITVPDKFELDDDSTAGNTRMLVYDVDNGQLERVTVGAADSGGTGFKVLRIPN